MNGQTTNFAKAYGLPPGPFDDLKYLISVSNSIGAWEVTSHVLEDSSFLVSSASISEGKHHNYKHGLLRHTREVTELCIKTYEILKSQHDLCLDVLILAAIFHDYGKIHEYDSDHGVRTPDGYTYGHIVMSYDFWRHCCVHAHPTWMNVLQPVAHCILSHHGNKAWGSPVTPNTREAIILHQADMMSARVDDMKGYV